MENKSFINRTKMVKAMEYIARQINDEEVFLGWLMNGVADGDIELGDLAVNADDADDMVDYYLDDETFADLMDTFLWVMNKARKSGGLYCDGVVSKTLPSDSGTKGGEDA